MTEYIVNQEDLSSIANAIREKTQTFDNLTFPNDFVSSIQSISSNETTITNGIIIKAVNANNQVTEVDFYGSVLPQYIFGAGRGDNAFSWSALNKINFKNSNIYLTQGNFFYCALTELSTNAIKGRDPSQIWSFNSNQQQTSIFNNMKSLKTLSLPDFEGFFNHYEAAGCSMLETIYLPKVTQFASYGSLGRGCFANDTKLQTVQLGSINYPVTFMDEKVFLNCTQTGLTITVYTTESYIDTIITNIRNCATNATIIIKASGDTNYNGTNYIAGDIILTSEVVS